MNIVLVTGGFDPIHSGHIEYFKAASALGDMLVVGLNSDKWLENKKGRPFMPFDERLAVVSNIKNVDIVISFDDTDGSAIDAIRTIRKMYPDDKIIFANGGDRNLSNIPELAWGFDNIDFVFGVGGEDKRNSSRWILDNWTKEKTLRSWGVWSVLEKYENVKVKELSVDPGCALSMQRHQSRQEFWFVAEGTATVNRITAKTEIDSETITQFHYTWIRLNEWHQLENKTKDPLKVVEIQWGERCEEDDIERKS